MYSLNGGNNVETLFVFDIFIPGLIKGVPTQDPKYLMGGTWIWTFKATGYSDKVVTVTVQ